MRLKVDKESDALYFRLDESSIVDSGQVEPGKILDFNAEGKVVAIDMLKLSGRMKPEQLNILRKYSVNPVWFNTTTEAEKSRKIGHFFTICFL